MQGGMLSPFLWCLTADKPTASLNRGGVYTQGHMHDICLLTVAKFPNAVLGLKQWTLHTIKRLGVVRSVCHLILRTQLTVSTRKRKLPFFGTPFFGVTLHHSMSVKYHEVVLDSWLTWRQHVSTKVKKAHNLLCACRKAYTAVWGLRLKVVH